MSHSETGDRYLAAIDDNARLRRELDAATAELEQLRARIAAPSLQWGVWWPGSNTTDPVCDEAKARAWIAEYKNLVGHLAELPRLKVRTAAPSPGRWHDPADYTPTAPPHDLGDYYIGSDSVDDSAHWAYVAHLPCGSEVWTGRYHPTNPGLASLMVLIAAHRCDTTPATEAPRATETASDDARELPVELECESPPTRQTETAPCGGSACGDPNCDIGQPGPTCAHCGERNPDGSHNEHDNTWTCAPCHIAASRGDHR